ncbi:uncharacterized protein LOC110758740 [Prunus avium]|uniref:Uncharacterized protein LOC110758740 n=1 Tax=Prunus avium TaxID=42229 RepID=A0A6P5SQ16_PRUAV|nr:uncharacterized protein LOC110758740 [Prunus avium]
MEIMEMVEKDAELRRCAFNPSSPAWKCVIYQLLLKIMEKTEKEDLHLVCISAIGNLTRTFEEKETRMIGPLVRFLDVGESGVTFYAPTAACIALTKFACTDNYFHFEHSKAIISAGGAKHFNQDSVSRGRDFSVSPGKYCSTLLYVSESEELAQAEVLAALSWASKQSFMTKYEELNRLMSKESQQSYDQR